MKMSPNRRLLYWMLPCALIFACSIFELQMNTKVVSPFRRQLLGMMDSMHEIELQRTLSEKFELPDASYSFEEVVRRLKGEKLLLARLKPYPDEKLTPGPRGWVLLFFHYSAMRVIHDFHNLQDDNCRRCRIAIHPGNSCDDPGLEDTFYSKSRLSEDPWDAKGKYLAFNHKSCVSNHAFTMTNGYSQSENMNRTVVIYNQSGEPQACGVLQIPDIRWYKNWSLQAPPDAPTTPV